MNVFRQIPIKNQQDKQTRKSRGFALVTTVSLMVLLAVMCVGLLGLSAVSLRSSTQTQAQAEAQANARLALMVALGELQKEMGPDMRVSAEAAIFDTDEDTENIDGVAQPRWLASYDSWGNWLNAEYTKPEGGGSLQIQSTYTPQRENMFRRWLLSMPEGMRDNPQAAMSSTGWNDSNSVVLVGEGTLGNGAEQSRPADITRAYLNPVGENGRHAWWISPENHKARIDLASRSRELSTDAWETAHGSTAEVGAGILDGLGTLDDNPELAEKLITLATLRPASVTEERAGELFYDLTAQSEGVLASVRSGHLKKDLSLLFEKDNGELPAPYRFNPGRDIREPSIRPMSPELLANNPTIPNRHFQSWTNMRHFYRMYRRDHDATVSGTAEGDPAAGALRWDRGRPPSTSFVATSNVGSTSPWDGSNNYWRFPVLAKITFIYSLRAARADQGSTPPGPATQYRCSVLFTPVFIFWNPYNVELKIPDNKFYMMNNGYRVLPFAGEVYANNQRTNNRINGASQSFTNLRSALRSDDGREIVFRPGELRVFSPRGSISGFDNNPLYPGFDPQAIGGEERSIATYTRSQRPAAAITFSESVQHGNHQWGNTPGSLCHTPDWEGPRIPLMSQIDWFQVADTRAPITPDPKPNAAGIAAEPGNLALWDLDNTDPLPVAYAQLTIKGISPIDYESIDWAQDWRGRSWLHSPPFYFGSSMYISENDTIAHTQRLDCPYIMHFGPTSMAEMPKIISHAGSSAFLGSGSNPFEQVNSISALELPAAPISSLAGFASMRANPGWADYSRLNPDLIVAHQGAIGTRTGRSSFYAAEVKATAYQSGVTAGGIGNSFIHPMIPRTGVYSYVNNSVSADPENRQQPFTNINYNDNKVFNDYWDHTLLLNDALWDDYFVSSLADQSRPGANSAASLNENINRLIDGQELANSRYRFHSGGSPDADVKADLQAADGYLKAAGHLVVDGMFNVNSTSVPAWYALFAGIRERQLVYRDAISGSLREIDVPSGKRIALARLGTEVSDKEMDDPATGASIGGNLQAWTGVRFLDDGQLLKLAEECVKQVKQRGPFLNFSEFINRRLSDNELGLIGALQAAIDYDDANPESGSINFNFKNGPDFMMERNAMGRTVFATPDAVNGSRFAGIPGYVIQSDLLRPISNTLSVRDDTFRIRAYGESREPGANGKVLARAWCEAIVQRVPEYCDPANDPSVPARLMDADGVFSDNPDFSDTNRRFGRKFEIRGFRWLNSQEI